MRRRTALTCLVVSTLIGAAGLLAEDRLGEIELLIQNRALEEAIASLESLPAAPAPDRRTFLLAVAYHLAGEAKDGDRHAAAYLAAERDPAVLADAHLQLGNAMISAQIDRGQAKKRLQKKHVLQGIDHLRRAVELEVSPTSHQARLALATALILAGGRPDVGLHDDEATRFFAEAYALLHAYVDREPVGENQMAARFLLCGHLDCQPLPYVPDAEILEPVLPVDGDTRGEVQPPRKVYNPFPPYIEAARSARVRGVVKLKTILDETGRVIEVEALSGLPYGLTESAARTVKTWTFEPALLDGEPVDVYYILTINFKLE